MEVQIANKSQSSVGLVDASFTLTGGVDQILTEDKGGVRGALLMMNCSAHDINFVFPSLGNANTAPTITAGAKGVYCLKAAASAGSQGGSYENDGGWVPQNEIWAKGTNGDVLVVSVTAA